VVGKRRILVGAVAVGQALFCFTYLSLSNSADLLGVYDGYLIPAGCTKFVDILYSKFELADYSLTPTSVLWTQ
jgi:hypothetical protein